MRRNVLIVPFLSLLLICGSAWAQSPVPTNVDTMGGLSAMSAVSTGSYVVTTAQTLTGDLTCSFHLEVIPPGTITASGNTLTMAAGYNFTAPPGYVVFGSASDDIRFAGPSRVVYPDWWAATSTGIQSAVDSLPTTGGMVRLTDRTYTSTGTITFTSSDSYATLAGNGWNSIIKIEDTHNASYDVIYLNGSNHNTLRDFRIDGNSSGQGAYNYTGIEMNGGSYHVITRLKIHDLKGSFDGDGLYCTPGAQPQYCEITHCVIDTVGDDGLDINDMDFSVIDSNQILSCSNNGIDTDGATYCTISNNVVKNAGTGGSGNGIELEQENKSGDPNYSTDTNYNVVIGNIIDAPNDDCVNISSGSYNTVSGNTCINAGNYGVDVDKGNAGGNESQYNVVSGNVILNAGTKGINEDTGLANYNTFVGNIVKCADPADNYHFNADTSHAIPDNYGRTDTWSFHIPESNQKVLVAGERIDASIASGDDILTIDAVAGEVTPTTVCSLVMSADEAWDATTSGSRFEFHTIGTGGTTLSEVMRIDGNKRVGINDTDPDDAFHVNGTDDNAAMKVERISDDATAPKFIFYKQRSEGTVATANDIMGQTEYYTNESTPIAKKLAQIDARVLDPTNGSEDSDIRLWTFLNGAIKETLTLSSGYVGIREETPLTYLDFGELGTYDVQSNEYPIYIQHADQANNAYTSTVGIRMGFDESLSDRAGKQALIEAAKESAWANSVGMAFWTSPDGTTTTERLRIAGSGAFDFYDNSVANVGDIALDTITSDAGTLITINDDLHIGADDAAETLTVHDAGTVIFKDLSDDTTVTLGPVTDGATTLGLTGSLTASGTVQAGTLTDGTISLSGGVLSGLASLTLSDTLTATTIADGAGFTATGGTISATSIDLGTTTLLASRALTVDTGAAFNVSLGSAAGDDFIIDGTGFVYEGDNNRVGIGTASPSETVEVAVNAVTGPRILLNNSHATSNNNELKFAGPSGTVGQIGTDWVGNGGQEMYMSTSGARDLVMSSSGQVGIGATDPDRLFHAEVSDAVTNAVTYAQRLSHITSGTPAAGLGTGIEFEIETSASNNEVLGTIDCVTTTATAGSEDGTINLKTMTAGAAATTKLSVGPSTIDFNGYYSTSHQNIPDLASKGAGYWFDGSNDKITIADNSALDFGIHDFSIIIAYNRHLIATSDTFLGTRFDGSNSSYITSTGSGAEIQALVTVGGAAKINLITSDYGDTKDSNNVLAIVSDRDTSNYVYKNGKLKTLSTNTYDSGATDIDLGAEWQIGAYNSSSVIPGTIFSVKRFNLALTAAEVRAFSSGAPVPYKYTGASQTALTSGTLTLGKYYTIDTYTSDDDFTNVGAASNAAGVSFVATGTTPTHWAHSSSLRHTGCVLQLEQPGIGTTQWLDISGSALHGTVSGATAINQPMFGGPVGIGTTSPGAMVEILKTTEQLRLSYDSTHSASMIVGSAGNYTVTTPASTTTYMPQVAVHDIAGDDNETIMYIDPDDGEMGYSSSSKKKKTNIQPATGIPWFYLLKPSTYNRIRDDGTVSDRQEYGLIAEEVAEVAPRDMWFDVVRKEVISEVITHISESEPYTDEAGLTVTPEPTEYTEVVSKEVPVLDESGAPIRDITGVNYLNLIAPIIAEVQRLNAEVEALKARVTELEKKTEVR